MKTAHHVQKVSEETTTRETTAWLLKSELQSFENLSSQSVNYHVLLTHDEAFSFCNSFVTHKEHAHPCPIADHDNCHFDLIDIVRACMVLSHPRQRIYQRGVVEIEG